MDKWDKRYTAAVSPGDPVDVLLENITVLEQLKEEAAGAELRSLDLACGLGANGLLLAELGFNSHCWDSSAVALQKLEQFAATRQLKVFTEQRDVETCPPDPESFDVIVVSRFLYRPLCACLIDALRPGGLIFYQTFSLAPDGSVPGQGPQNRDYRLAHGELLTLFEGMDVIDYREAPLQLNNRGSGDGRCGSARWESWLVGGKVTTGCGVEQLRQEV